MIIWFDVRDIIDNDKNDCDVNDDVLLLYCRCYHRSCRAGISDVDDDDSRDDDDNDAALGNS